MYIHSTYNGHNVKTIILRSYEICVIILGIVPEMLLANSNIAF